MFKFLWQNISLSSTKKNIRKLQINQDNFKDYLCNTTKAHCVIISVFWTKEGFYTWYKLRQNDTFGWWGLLYTTDISKVKRLIVFYIKCESGERLEEQQKHCVSQYLMRPNCYWFTYLTKVVCVSGCQEELQSTGHNNCTSVQTN